MAGATLLLLPVSLSVITGFASPASATPTSLLTNGSFETGNFTGWTPSATNGCTGWQVYGSPASPCFSGGYGFPPNVSAVAGNDFASVTWDGYGNLDPELTQTVTIPANTTDTLTWSDNASWDLTDYGATKNRIASVDVLSGNNVLESHRTFTMVAHTSGNTGWVSHGLDLSAYAGHTVGIRFHLTVPEDFTGPAIYSLDNVALTSVALTGGPTAQISSPPDNQTYSTDQVVPTSFSCLEGATGPGLSSCTDSNGASGTTGSLDTSTPGAHLYRVTATSTDGQTGSASIIYTVVGGPSAQIDSPASNQTYSVGQVVPTRFACADSTGSPGLRSCTDSNGGSGNTGTLDTSAPGSFTYTVTATGNDGATGSASINYTVAAAPTAQISSPAGNQTYSVGQVVPTSFSCNEGASGPGISSCNDSNGGSGTSGTLDTSTAGPQSYTVTATSTDGQSGSASIPYEVVDGPSAQINSPVANQTYSVGQFVPTTFVCADSTDSPGLSSCTDSNGGSGTSGNLDTSTAGSFTYTVTATGNDAVTGSASINYTVAAAPTAQISSPADNQTFSVGQVVPTSFSCAEGASGPGISSCTDSNGTSGGNGTLDTSTTGAQTYTVTATSSDGQTGSASINYTVAAAPTAQISSPADGQTYSVGQDVPTSFSCTEGAGGPGLSSCSDSNGGSGSSGTLDTSTAGPQTYTVTATSNDGETGTATIDYTVAAGPTAQITSPPGYQTYSVGLLVPTTFSCSDGTGGPGIASCTDSNGGSGTSGTLDTSTTGTHTYTVTATSADGQTGTASISYTVANGPTAQINSPANHQTYSIGEVVPTSFSCAEGTSGPELSSCTDSNGGSGTTGTLDTSTAGSHTYTVTATSTDGQTGSASISYDVAAAPSAAIHSPADGQTYSVGQAVPTSFSCTEGTGGPGISSCTDSNGDSGGVGTLDTSTTGSHTYTVTATSGDGQTGSDTIGYTVANGPTAHINSPANHQTYRVGQVVPTSFSCSEGTGGPGIASCTDSNGGSGTTGTLDTSTAGSHTYTVTATSTDGQTGSASISYTVAAAPSAVIHSPTGYHIYAAGEVVPTSFSCNEGTGGPGIASCTDSNGGSGTTGTLDTSTTGTHTYTVTATSTDGQTGSASIQYTVAAVPTVTAVSPKSGPITGGQLITITGTGFITGATVEVGQGSGAGTTALQATSVHVISPTEITAVTGGSAKPGAWQLYVTTAGGTSPWLSGQSPADSYTYTAVTPTVTAISPKSGPVAGGQTIIITGTAFTPGATVKIGQGGGSGGAAVQATSVHVISPTEITAVTGGSAKAGAWQVYVTTLSGTSAWMPGTNPPDTYTYTSH